MSLCIQGSGGYPVPLTLIPFFLDFSIYSIILMIAWNRLESLSIFCVSIYYFGDLLPCEHISVSLVQGNGSPVGIHQGYGLNECDE